MLHQLMSYAASASSDAPTPARAVLDEWIAHMPFEGETPAERMMLRREAQEASAEQAGQELLADEVATKPKKGKHKMGAVDGVRVGNRLPGAVYKYGAHEAEWLHYAHFNCCTEGQPEFQALHSDSPSLLPQRGRLFKVPSRS